MGRITFTAKRNGQTAISYAVDISDANLDRVLAAQAAVLFPTGVAENVIVTTPDGDVQELHVRQPTPREIFDKLCETAVSHIANSTRKWHQRDAARSAEAAVDPIPTTKV